MAHAPISPRQSPTPSQPSHGAHDPQAQEITTLMDFIYLQEEVEGYPRQQDVREELQNTKDRVDHPVGQPLRVVILLLRVYGLDAGHGVGGDQCMQW